MNAKKVSDGLGWFSIALGTVQLVAPRRLGRAVGVGDHPAAMRTMGLREVASGVMVLTQRRPAFGLWSRVAGDVLDLTLLASALRHSRSSTARIAAAAGMALAVGVVDYACARVLSKG